MNLEFANFEAAFGPDVAFTPSDNFGGGFYYSFTSDTGKELELKLFGVHMPMRFVALENFDRVYSWLLGFGITIQS